MATIGGALERVIAGAATALGRSQVAVNKILWGKGNTQPVQTVKYDPVSGSLAYIVTKTKATPPKAGNLIQSGLFNALDALNQVDLCNVVTYVATNINVPKKPRPPKEEWTAAEKALYFTQDTAGQIVAQIDKYTAFPNTLIGSYAGVGSNPIPPNRAIEQSGVPEGSSDISGTNVKKYNMYNLMQNMKDVIYTLSPNTSTTSSIFTNEDRELMGMVPGLSSNLNILNDFVGTINKYSDYRSISNDDLIKLENKIAKIRAVCVAIQNLDFKRGLAAVGNLLNIDIRKQIQELNKYIDPTKIIPTLKQINSAIKSFISIANRIQGILKTAQFIIKLLILFVKIFKFLIKFFLVLPLPNLFTTSGVQSTLDKARSTAENQTDSVTRLLKEINALLTIIIGFIRYLLANANELLARLQPLLASLEACQALKDSGANTDILSELNATTLELQALRDNLADYITAIDSRTNPNTATFGKYSIRVVDEEITDKSVKNKRRRGIALDQNGRFVVQSDLTFATDPNIIINEVKLKLVSEGLVQPGLAQGIDTVEAAVVIESLTYLDEEDIDSNDLTLPDSEVDDPENEDEEQGIGLNAFINKLKGGKRLRRRVRRAMANQKRQLAASLAKEDPKGSLTAKSIQKINKSAIQDEIASLQANIGVRRQEILALYALSPIPNPGTLALIARKTKDIVDSNNRIKELRRQLGR